MQYGRESTTSKLGTLTPSGRPWATTSLQGAQGCAARRLPGPGRMSLGRHHDDHVEAESAMALNGELHRMFRRGTTLHMFEALAVMRSAEVASTYCDAVLAAAGGLCWVGESGSAIAWRTARESLRPFNERCRPQLTVVVESAIRLEADLTQELGPESAIKGRHDLAEVATGIRIVANLLPLVADRIESQARRWARLGRLQASAAELPMREDRVKLALHRTTVTVDVRDLRPTVNAIRTAGVCSANLAVDLDRSVGRVGTQPQPLLAARHAVRVAKTAVAG